MSTILIPELNLLVSLIMFLEQDTYYYIVVRKLYYMEVIGYSSEFGFPIEN